MGIEKVKQLLREKVYFPGIDKAAEDMIKNCLPCQCVSHPDPPEPLKMSKFPPGPWRTLNIDFLGPISSSKYILVAIDQFSRFPEAEITRSTEASSVIPRLQKIFSVHGLPHKIYTDNGPPWHSNEIKQFMLENGIDHHPVTPHYPQANGLVENINKPIMKAIRTAQVEHRHWHHALFEFLVLYKATPHSSTKFSPSQLLFNRPIRTKLPHCSSTTVETSVLSAARRNDHLAKNRPEYYADKRRRSKPCPLRIGDTVIVKRRKRNKLSTTFDPTPFVIIARKGNMITAKGPEGMNNVTRNSTFFKKVSINHHLRKREEGRDDRSDDSFFNLPVHNQNNHQPQQHQVEHHGYPRRNRNRPRYYHEGNN